MKPLLRVVLVIDALLLLAGGVLFVLTPWKALYDALQLVQIDPAMAGQILGIALLGLAWLAFHAALDGDLTSGVARAVGHVNWLIGVVMVVWLIGLHRPELTAFGQLVSVATAVVLFVVGLGGVRLAATVRKRERLKALEAKTGAAGSAASSPAQPAPVVVPPQPAPVVVPPQPHPAATTARVEPSVGTVTGARPATGSGTAPSPTYAAPSGTSAATSTSSAAARDASIHRDPPIHG